MRRGLKVFVYKNLNRACFSVRDVKTGRVLCHCDSLLLKDATFKVSEAGRQRVLREGRKNVHAGVEGELVLDPDAFRNYCGFLRRVRYDPYRSGRFLDPRGKPVADADYVYFTGGKVFV